MVLPQLPSVRICPSAMIRMERTSWTVHWYKVMIDTKTITLRITVGEKTSLKHLVGRETDAVDDICRIKGSLLNLGKEILRITVKFKDTHITKREILMIPHLCQIETDLYGIPSPHPQS